MNFSQALTDYLQLRRSLGFHLERDGKALMKFVLFLEQRAALYLTTKLALEWAQEQKESQLATRAQRLTYVRGFARYCSAIDSRTEIPPETILPYRPKRARPHIYTDAQIRNLMLASLKLPGSEWRRQTFYHLIGLLSVTGMRISEAIALQVSDVDLDSSLLKIEKSKFGKSRLIPLHDSTKAVIAKYLHRREQCLAGQTAHHLFFTRTFNRLDQGSIRHVFYELSRTVGIRGQHDSHGPRLHDFRHRFAIKTITNWYELGEDVDRHLPTLSTYLGHSHVADTYWYVAAYPELMEKVVAKIEKHFGDLS